VKASHFMEFPKIIEAFCEKYKEKKEEE
jgi:hypothetical protein